MYILSLMEREKLKKFVLDEFKKEAQQKIAAGEKGADEFISENIDGLLLDRLIDEFCAKNPADWEVLNVFRLSDEQANEIKRDPEKAIASGIINRLKYEQIINNAGLAYKKSELDKDITSLLDLLLSEDN